MRKHCSAPNWGISLSTLLLGGYIPSVMADSHACQSTFNQEARSGVFYCGGMGSQQPEEWFSDAREAAMRSNREFCEASGLNFQFESTEGRRCVHAFGEHYCSERWTFRCAGGNLALRII